MRRLIVAESKSWKTTYVKFAVKDFHWENDLDRHKSSKDACQGLSIYCSGCKTYNCYEERVSHECVGRSTRGSSSSPTPNLGEAPVVCTKCGKEMSSIMALNNHRSNTTGPCRRGNTGNAPKVWFKTMEAKNCKTENSNECPICYMQFANPLHLRTHRRSEQCDQKGVAGECIMCHRRVKSLGEHYQMNRRCGKRCRSL